MLAFEIKINNSAPMIVAADNHVIADFTYGVLAINPNSVLIAGFDDFNKYVWLDGEIHHNDEVHIRVVDVDKDKVSVPTKTTKKSLERLKEKYDKLQQKLKTQESDMKGIIVKSRIAEKDDKTKVAIPNGIATAALTISRNDEVVWGIGAMTMPEGKSLSWNGGRMNVGDSISLKFTDVDEPGKPLSQEFEESYHRR